MIGSCSKYVIATNAMHPSVRYQRPRTALP